LSIVRLRPKTAISDFEIINPEVSDNAAGKCAVIIIIPYYNLLEHATTGSSHSVLSRYAFGC
jgi:hypothetical protein